MINYSNGQYTGACIFEYQYMHRHTLNITFHWNLKEKDFRETKA